LTASAKSDAESCHWIRSFKDLHMLETLQTYVLQLFDRFRRDDEARLWSTMVRQDGLSNFVNP
jgi:hypothetical protein